MAGLKVLSAGSPDSGRLDGLFVLCHGADTFPGLAIQPAGLCNRVIITAQTGLCGAEVCLHLLLLIARAFVGDVSLRWRDGIGYANSSVSCMLS